MSTIPAADARPARVTAEKRGNALALLGSKGGVRHATALPSSTDGTVHVMAEVDAGAAEEILEALESLGVPPDDIGLARRSWIQPAGATVTTGSALMWAGVLGVPARSRESWAAISASCSSPASSPATG